MRRLILLVVILLTVSLPAMGHTNLTHSSEPCGSNHGYILDPGPWRHNTRFINIPGPGQSYSNVYHQEYVLVDGSYRWMARHTTKSGWCGDS